VKKQARELTSAASVNLGILSVVIGASVYTMKSACTTRKAAIAAAMKELECMLVNCHT
jgi:hypothetical protein